MYDTLFMQKKKSSKPIFLIFISKQEKHFTLSALYSRCFCLNELYNLAGLWHFVTTFAVLILRFGLIYIYLFIKMMLKHTLRPINNMRQIFIIPNSAWAGVFKALQTTIGYLWIVKTHQLHRTHEEKTYLYGV